MKNYNIAKLILGVIFFSISIIHFINYNNYRRSLKKREPISYSYVDRKINTGGRGESYEMTITYDKKKYKINLTSKEYYEINDEMFPILYYSKGNNLVFSEWEMKRAYRIFLVFIIMFLITIIPFSRLRP